ncbi:MAG: radical SAM protein [Planctomycetia bacterium]|nr:radical SAM protein [Planctomycetia bacterium]
MPSASTNPPAEYAALKPWALPQGILYGPFPTRRKGRALGVNLLPPGDKACTFNCAYCQCGWTPVEVFRSGTWKESCPSLDEVRRGIEGGFAALQAEGNGPDAIVVSGNGEPTLYPWFEEAVELVLAARDQWFPKVRTMVLTAGTELGRPEIRRACDRLDERCVKLDAGDAKTLKKVDIPLVPFSLEGLVANCAKLRDVTIQSFFTQGAVDNTTEPALAAWLDRLDEIGPVEVQVYSLDRVPAAKGLKRVPRAELEAIARRASQRLGVPAHVF